MICTAAVGSLTVFFLAIAVSGHEGVAQQPNGMSTAHSQMRTSGGPDAAFAKKAAQGGLAEVKLGQLAQEKGSSRQVKDFGKRMVADHSKANENLKQVASQQNLSFPMQLGAKDEATYDRLSRLSGQGFDRAYARLMVKDHEKDIAAFQNEANNGRSEAVKNFAAQTLPTLQEHLKLAREMDQTVMGSAHGNSTPGEGSTGNGMTGQGSGSGGMTSGRGRY
ncbi:MAG: DUF4142 domain-containing protein [Terriglobia bacterium]